MFFDASQGGQHPQLEPPISQQKNLGTYMSFSNKDLFGSDKS